MGKRVKTVTVLLLLTTLVFAGVRLGYDPSSFTYDSARPRFPRDWSPFAEFEIEPAPPADGPDGLFATWEAVDLEIEAPTKKQKASGRREIGMRLKITANKIVWSFTTPEGEKSHDGVYRIDPNKEPKEIDWGEPDKINPGKVVLGIYKINGATLTLHGGAERPKGFAEPTLVRLVLRRTWPRE